MVAIGHVVLLRKQEPKAAMCNLAPGLLLSQEHDPPLNPARG